MRAIHRVGGRWPRQHQAHSEENSYLHYLSSNCAYVKPKFSKVRLWVKCRSQTQALRLLVAQNHATTARSHSGCESNIELRRPVLRKLEALSTDVIVPFPRTQAGMNARLCDGRHTALIAFTFPSLT
jgi:hypothetical protein